MSKERLSKLQRWILESCYKNDRIHKFQIKEYFGKERKEGLTNSQRVVRYRCLANMIQKGLIRGDNEYILGWGKGAYVLTERGLSTIERLRIKKDELRVNDLDSKINDLEKRVNESVF